MVKGEYAGRVHGGGASVAIAIHGTRAIAYVCNGSVVEAWFQGTAVGGRLVMTGKNGAQLNATYYAKKANGTVVADGFHYRFSVPAVRKPSGLYRATADVRGATIKAGETAEYDLGADRHAYLVPAAGAVEVNGVRLATRDGAAISGEPVLKVTALEDAEVVLVDAA